MSYWHTAHAHHCVMEKGDPTPYPIFPGVILPLDFCTDFATTWMLSGPSPFLENCTSRSLLGKPSWLQVLSLPPGLHSTLHGLPRPQAVASSPLPIEPLRRGRRKRFGLSPTHRRCLVLVGCVSIWKVLSSVKPACSLGPLHTCPRAWRQRCSVSSRAMKLTLEIHITWTAFFSPVTRPAFQSAAWYLKHPPILYHLVPPSL